MRHLELSYTSAQAHLNLIDGYSSTARQIHCLLRPLERSTHIHIILNRKTGLLDIHLHRYKLDFHLTSKPTRLQSKQFPGMFVDEDQAIGTFTGLESKLTLRNLDGNSRMIIVPCGTAQFSRQGNHVLVNVNNDLDERATYQVYHVDKHLQRLRGNGTLKSRLFQCYLHALTSHCVTDSLTGRTGTEESLEGLRSARTLSFLRLGEEETHLLECIARLTPHHEYYPSHLRVMQQVEWQDLPILSQHYEFIQRVEEIVRHALSLRIWNPDVTDLTGIVRKSDQGLLQSAAMRQAAYCVDGFGADAHNSSLDVLYRSRDISDQHATRATTVVNTARLVDSWSPCLRPCPNLLKVIEDWETCVSGIDPDNPLDLGYDKVWLQQPGAVLPRYFGRLQTTLAAAAPSSDKYKIMFFLSTLAFAEHAQELLCHTLLAFSIVPELRELQFPAYASFTLQDGYSPDPGKLRSIGEAAGRTLEDCPEQDLKKESHETESQFEQRQEELYDSNILSSVESFESQLMSQWPTEMIVQPSIDVDTYIILRQALSSAQPLFRSWFQNAQFRNYVHAAQAILSELCPPPQQVTPYTVTLPSPSSISISSYTRFEDLVRKAPVVASPDRTPLVNPEIRSSEKPEPDHALRELLMRLSFAQESRQELDYVTDLWESFDALQLNHITELDRVTFTEKDLRQHLDQCKSTAKKIYHSIQARFHGEISLSQMIAATAGLVPRTSPIALLSCLVTGKQTTLTADWKQCITRYGLALSAIQHAERLLACRHNQTDLIAELRNPGHIGWDPMARPDWLLFELENNLRIRPVQAQIAEEMASPSTGSNSVLQLNMGEGKTSVITPMVAVSLADGNKLVRIVVLKPLSTQMFNILADRLGGMLNRPVIQMPYARSLQLNVDQVRSIRDVYNTCMRAGGVLLVQPEHITSFELMVYDSYLMNRLELGEALRETQLWLNNNSRDILDESDEILSVRFELVYTVGMQTGVGFAPNRWIITQQVLGGIARLLAEAAADFEEGILSSNPHRGAFPRIRVIDEGIGKRFLQRVLQRLCQNGIHSLPVSHLSSNQRDALEKYLSVVEVSSDLLTPLRSLIDDSTLNSTLLVMRGLFAHGVLLFAFQRKRWRVSYGTDLSRSQLAIPYCAKDSPEPRSEFSHPEVIIVLTCLSYYYSGLNDDQLRQSFETLTTLDDSEGEYAYWVRDADGLSLELKSLTGVNLRDQVQCSQSLFPSLRFAKSVIDFFLSHHVFRYEMREFPSKLSASSWNLARAKTHPTTGFSGTNDSKHVFPLSIAQRDLPQQRHTNAAVLGCLLRPQNSFVSLARYSRGRDIGAQALLDALVSAKPSIRVLIDVGAQILEWKNEQMARNWLSRMPQSEVKAAVFFDDTNEILVIDRDGSIETLATSPFAATLDRCVVYLDEVHTRGTDLRLPENFRAAVTLAVGLTKDRLVQGTFVPNLLELKRSYPL